MIVFNLIGGLLILFVVYWFWFAKVKGLSVVGAQTVTIKIADGVYTPSSLEVKQGSVITLNFIREDVSSCAQTVLFPDFEKSIEVPMKVPTTITLHPKKVGEYEFTCQMGMYRGKLIVTKYTSHGN